MGRPGRLSMQTSQTRTATPTMAVKTQSCFVCYAQFTPFSLDNNMLESLMMKMFYNVMNIPSLGSGGDDEDDEEDEAVISLPFCPQCHSKISIMYSLHSQIQSIHTQFESVRNEIAFTVVETNPKNCKNGPMDLMRQQIFQHWNEKYEEKKNSGELDRIMNSDAIIPKMPFFELDKSFSSKLNSSYRSSLPNGNVRSGNANNAFDDEDDLTSENSFNGHDRGGRPVRKASATKRYIEDEEYLPKPGTKRMRISKKSMMSPGSPLPKMPKLIPMGVVPVESSTSRRQPFKKNFLDINPRDDSYETEEMMIEPYGYDEYEASNESDPLAFSYSGQHDDSVFKKPAQVGRYRGKFQQQHDQDPLGNDYLSSDEGMFECQMCPKIYTNQGRLKRHESLCHPTSKAVHCEICQKGFSSMLTMRRHMQNLHNQAVEGAIKCKFCPKSFVKKFSYDLHMKSHGDPRSKRYHDGSTDVRNGLRNNNIPSSGAKVAGGKNLKRPFRKPVEPKITLEPGGRLNCPNCKSRFPLASLLRVHLLYCDPTEKKTDIAEETEDLHVVGERNIICQECGIYLSPEELASHQERHAEVEAELNEIMDEEDSEEDVEDVCPCKICGEEVLVAELMDHEMTHTDPFHKSLRDLKKEKQDDVETDETEVTKESNENPNEDNLAESQDIEDISEDEANQDDDEPICKIVETKQTTEVTDDEKMPELEEERDEKEVDNVDDDNLVIDEKGSEVEEKDGEVEEKEGEVEEKEDEVEEIIPNKNESTDSTEPHSDVPIIEKSSETLEDE